MKRFIILFALILNACGTTTAAPTPDVNAISTSAVKTALAPFTQTAAADATQQHFATRNAQLTQAVLLLPTNTPAPTATITLTPNATQTTQSILYGPHLGGYYLAGKEIGYGIWRAPKGLSHCYWELLDKVGNIIQNDNGPTGGTVYVSNDVYMVHFDDGSSRVERCPAIYEYVGPG